MFSVLLDMKQEESLSQATKLIIFRSICLASFNVVIVVAKNKKIEEIIQAGYSFLNETKRAPAMS